MNHFIMRIEQVIILLLSHGKTSQAKFKKLRQLCKDYHPRKWKPRSPSDCPSCQSGISLAILKPNPEVSPYSERKSTRGRQKRISTTGHACPNPGCDYLGVTDPRIHALVGDGKRGKNKHIQYWKCQWCDKRFTSRLHTPLYYLKSDEEHVILALMLLAEGCDISVLVRCSKHCEATITRWLERAGKHRSRLHDRFCRDLVLIFVQLDELYGRVRHIGKLWLWLAIDPVTKILPSLHLGHRKNEDAMIFTHDLKLRLKPDCVPAFTTAGLRGYFYSITAHFGRWFRPARARTDHWQVSEDLLHGQLVKQHKRGTSKFAIMRMRWGQRQDFNQLLEEHGFAALIQTAFSERVNLTIRRGVAPLMRKTWSLAVSVPGLRQPRPRSPAMAANLTNRLWSVEEVLKLPLAPALS